MSISRYIIFHKDHLLHVTGPNSGAEMATLCLAKALVQDGKQVVVCAQLDEGDKSSDGIEYWNLGPDFDVGKALRRAEQGTPYHLISAGRAQPILESRCYTKCRSRVLISHDRSGNDTGIKPEVLCRVADAIVCVSEAQREVFLRAGADPSKLKVLYNGVDLDLFKAGEPDSRNYRKLVFVGALIEDKGIHWLIESFCQLKAKYPDLTLEVYGCSSLWGRAPLFDEQAIERQVPGIKFHGKVSQAEVAKAYATAGMCVIPSIWFDPFPLTSLEAQACGCPVLAFDVGGLKEGIRDGETGLVIQEVSQARLTAVLDGLLADPTKLKQFSQNALCISRPKYTWDKVAQGVQALCAGSKNASGAPLTRKTLALLSTWNQECGLATYARFMVQAFPQNTYLVLGEEGIKTTQVDEEFVERCWKRGSTDFSKLEHAIQKHNIGLLHLNVHYRFFSQPHFSEFLQAQRERGVKIIAHLHQVFTVEPQLQSLLKVVDRVIVHSNENGLELIANGCPPEIISVVPHGVVQTAEIDPPQRTELRHRLAMKGECILLAFGFIQPHKGMEGILEGVHRLRQRGIDAYGYLCGRSAPDDPRGQEYLNSLKSAAQQLGIAEYVIFLDRFLTEQEVTQYLQAADVVLMNYQSQHYEASGACSLSVGAGCVVATSIAPAFMPFGSAVWHITTGFPVGVSLELLATHGALRDAIRLNALEYAKENSWQAISARLFEIYRGLNFEPEVLSKEKVVENRTMYGTGRLRVLMQNRPNARIQAGGDTIVMEKTVEGLTRRGVDVTVDLDAKEDPARFDVVHLFNFATPDLTREYAHRAHTAGTPFVVTTLYEDVPCFHNQSRSLAESLVNYTRLGQNRDWYRDNRVDPAKVPASQHFDNSWTAENAAVLITNGLAESATVRRDHPRAKRIVEIKLGCEVGTARPEPEQFIAQYGVRDFILCVGRLESRKNQLMLLKALENSELPVVLASGGFSYQPDYDQAVRNFKRKGQTLVLGRLTPEMLASAYAAARVHAIPSWYELPGLVSLEAASYGCNVVVTPYGTAQDYFGDKAFYCEPSSESSIYNAVLAAYYAPRVQGLAECARSHTWDTVAEQTLRLYEEVRKPRVQATQAGTTQPTLSKGLWKATPLAPAASVPSEQTNSPEAIIHRAEEAVRGGRYGEAHDVLSRAEQTHPTSARIIRAHGAVYLAEGQHATARGFFARAVAIDPRDAKAVCGRGMCELLDQRTEEAYHIFIESLKIDPKLITAINNLLRCSYILNRFDDLERALRTYTTNKPEDIDMRYCLAGCLFKLGRSDEAQSILDSILATNPQHRGASELKDHIRREAATRVEAPQAPAWQAALSPAAPAQAHNDLDNRLASLEEAKRSRKHDGVKAGCNEILASPTARPEQRTRATLLLAEMQVLEGELDTALTMFGQVLTSDSKNARAICGKGAILAHRDQWAEAESLFNQALLAQSDYDIALAGVGLCHSRRGNLEQAWDYYWRASKRNPENLRALLGLIETGYPLKQHAMVEEALRSYLEMHPASLEFLYSLAGCYYAQNKLQEARAEVEKIMLFNPAHQHALELKRVIDEKMGLRPQAAWGA